jgi:hypothetical protein
MAKKRLTARKSWRPRKLNVNLALAMTLRRHKEAVTITTLAVDFGVGKSTAHRNIEEMEVVLEEVVAIPKSGTAQRNKATCIVADATETQIQRPRKGQKAYYSGKTKCHTVKTETMIEFVSGQIVAVSETFPGAVHDFMVHKKMERLPSETLLLADSGYQGVAKLHPHSWIPDKKPKDGKLSTFSVLWNRALALLRVSVEHIFAKLKSFKALACKWRRRPWQYNRTFRIIAGIVNKEMKRPNVLAKWQENISRRIRKANSYLRESWMALEAAFQVA